MLPYSDIDDIIVSYVESILEDLESESDLDLESLVETLTAYLPQSQDIPEEAITEWIFNLAKDLRNKESKGKEQGADREQKLTNIHLFMPSCLFLSQFYFSGQKKHSHGKQKIV